LCMDALNVSKYLNNIVEQDHRFIKKRIRRLPNELLRG